MHHFNNWQVYNERMHIVGSLWAVYALVEAVRKISSCGRVRNIILAIGIQQPKIFCATSRKVLHNFNCYVSLFSGICKVSVLRTNADWFWMYSPDDVIRGTFGFSSHRYDKYWFEWNATGACRAQAEQMSIHHTPCSCCTVRKCSSWLNFLM